MIVDSFIFYNELDLLEFRLKLLYDHVDYFVLVEADRTFSGKPKPFYFEEAAERFAWAKDKLLHYKACLSLDGLLQPEKRYYFGRDSDYFKLEYQQRNAIQLACDRFDANTTLLISDLDEIPSREALEAARAAKKKLFGLKTSVCAQKLFYYKLDYMAQSEWYGTILTTVGKMRKQTPQGLRDRRESLPRIANGGWSMSYFGDSKFIANKINAFAHQEFNREDFVDHNRLSQYIEAGVNLFNDVPLSRIARSMFPEYFLDLAQANEDFFFAPQIGKVNRAAS